MYLKTVWHLKLCINSLYLLFFSSATTAFYYYLQTFGVDLNVKTVSIPDMNDSVELFIYDSSGQEFYNEWLSKYVSNDNENETSYNKYT